MKLNPLTYLISALSLSVAVLAYAYFMHYSPNMAEVKSFTDTAETMENDISKKPQAKKRVENAAALLQQTDSDWHEIELAKTPPESLKEGGIDLSVNRYQLTVDAPTFRNNLQKIINNQVKVGGVQVLIGPQVPAFSPLASKIVETDFQFPTTYSFPVLIYDLGPVMVQGTFDQICKNVESWTNVPNMMAVTQGLSITGTSPELLGTYNLSVVVMIRRHEVSPPMPDVELSKDDNSGSGGSGNGGGGGGFGRAGRGGGGGAAAGGAAPAGAGAAPGGSRAD